MLPAIGSTYRKALTSLKFDVIYSVFISGCEGIVLVQK